MGLNNTMVDFVNANFLTQMTDKPTRNDSILDLTLTTNPDLIRDLEIHPGISDHCAVTYNVNLAVKRQKKPDRYVYQYRKGDLERVKHDLGAFKDDFLSKEPLKRPVNDNWNLLKGALVSSIKKKITSRWNLPWMTTEIKRLCRKLKRAWDAGRHNRNSHSWKPGLDNSTRRLVFTSFSGCRASENFDIFIENKNFPIDANIFVMQGKCLFSEFLRPGSATSSLVKWSKTPSRNHTEHMSTTS